MRRREFLQVAALLSAGTSVIPKGWALTPEQSEFLASRPPYIEQHTPTLFSQRQRAAVTAAAEQIIPRTDTPGAIDAGAPRFIELLVQDWFTDSERHDFLAGLDDLLQRSGGDFAALGAAEQLAVLETLEDESADSPWYDFGSTLRMWDDTAPFICQLKELTVLGFNLSEVGATQFLRINPMGKFDGDYPLVAGDGAYDKDTLLRKLAMESSS